MREGRGPLKDCERCPDRTLCDIVDSADIQFWPEEHRLEEVSRRCGKPVSQTEYERVRDCLVAGTWVPAESERRGPEKVTGEGVVCEPGTASSTTNRPNAKDEGSMGAMIVTVPSALREKLGDDAARALVELLAKTAGAESARESPTRDIQQHIDRALTNLESNLKAFVVTAASLLFLAVSIMMAVQLKGV